MTKIFLSLGLAAVLFSCADKASQTTTATSDSFNLSEVKKSIEATNKQFSDAVGKGDSATVVSFYHSDAKVYPPNMPEGKSSVLGSMSKQLPAMGVKSFTVNTSDVTGNAEQVVETGTWEMGDGSKKVDNGKYIVVWKKENGNWKVWRDIWNSDNPPPPPPSK